MASENPSGCGTVLLTMILVVLGLLFMLLSICGGPADTPWLQGIGFLMAVIVIAFVSLAGSSGKATSTDRPEAANDATPGHVDAEAAARATLAFCREIAHQGSVWTMTNEDHTALDLHGADGSPLRLFWSRQSLAMRTVADISGVRQAPIKVGADMFVRAWLSEMERKSIGVGVDWPGLGLGGVAIAPAKLREMLEEIMKKDTP